MLENCAKLNELTLPTFTDSSKQVLLLFLRELDQYFELKAIPENLKLPLASLAIFDPYDKSWIEAVYGDLRNYDEFREKFSKLLWKEIQQSSVRFSIFQTKYDRSSGETMQGYFLRYAGLAAKLEPPLSELDLVNAKVSH
jgi:hypothetical protein